MARENNQTRFFLEDRFYELHKKELADMMKKQAEENMKVCFRDGYSGIVPTMNGYSEGANVGFTPHPTSPTLGEGVDSAYSRGGQNGLINFGTENQGGIPVTKGSLGDYASPAGGGLEVSVLTAPSYGASVSNGSQQFAGGYGNGYAADYTQPTVAAENSQSMLPGGMTPTTAQNLAGVLKDVGSKIGSFIPTISIFPYSIERAVINTPKIYSEYQKLQQENLNDINKHQYLSCYLNQNLGDNAGITLGALKELKDIAGKSYSTYRGSTKYGSYEDILRDSQKDMINNYIGDSYATMEAKRIGKAQNVDCSRLKQHALGGQSVASYGSGVDDTVSREIVQKEEYPIPLEIVNDNYNGLFSGDFFQNYRKKRYGY